MKRGGVRECRKEKMVHTANLNLRNSESGTRVRARWGRPHPKRPLMKKNTPLFLLQVPAPGAARGSSSLWGSQRVVTSNVAPLGLKTRNKSRHLGLWGGKVALGSLDPLNTVLT